MKKIEIENIEAELNEDSTSSPTSSWVSVDYCANSSLTVNTILICQVEFDAELHMAARRAIKTTWVYHDIITKF